MGSNMEVYKDFILVVLVLKLQIVGFLIINNELYKNFYFSCDIFNNDVQEQKIRFFNWINILILDCFGGVLLNYFLCGFEFFRIEDDEDVILVLNFRF